MIHRPDAVFAVQCVWHKPDLYNQNLWLFNEKARLLKLKAGKWLDSILAAMASLNKLWLQLNGNAGLSARCRPGKMIGVPDHMSSHYLNRLAVCSWSLQPESPEQLLSQLNEIGIPRVQIALDPIRERPEVWSKTADLFKKEGIAFISGMFGTIGEDYTSLESIKRTGGVTPDEHWDANWKNIQATAELAAQMGLHLVTFHAGFLPHEPSDPSFDKLIARIGQIADLFALKKIALGFETGQEDAPTLESFLSRLGRDNVGVNFDPANMILYDKGNPIEALRVLGSRLKQVHIKDAIRTKTAGTWGEEVPAGKGEVDWKSFFKTLDELKFTGFCSIEREAGTQRAEDIKAAREMVANL
jgi:sugar phosphate isomerase/epimerase